MRGSTLLLLAVSVVFALQQQKLVESRKVVFTRDQHPLDWNKAGSAKLDEKITFFVALKQRNVRQLESVLEQVAKPSSKLYGQWWSYNQVPFAFASPYLV